MVAPLCKKSRILLSFCSELGKKEAALVWGRLLIAFSICTYFGLDRFELSASRSRIEESLGAPPGMPLFRGHSVHVRVGEWPVPDPWRGIL
jgi:hypothetical protein